VPPPPFFLNHQIFNLVSCRRINDELNFFEGLPTSRLFLIILAIIVTCQALIINFMGMFFKVQPLIWQEWLVTVAIGAGAMGWSLLIRLASRQCQHVSGCGCTSAIAAFLTRMNKVRSKAEAHVAVYSAPEGSGLSVHEAVTLARGKAAAAAAEAAAAEAEGRKKKRERRGRAGTREERTMSGRSDSAGSLV
jgi:hypothetical protein